ncbi:MAG: hypothetical protein AAFQ64_03870 [Pseudomonadota bacterium]
MPKVKSDQKMRRSARNISQRLFALCVFVFFSVFGLMLLNQFNLGGVVVDVRVGDDGPEMLFRGDIGLWVPASWMQYYWFTSKHLILLPFAVFAIVIAYWHNWETANAETESSRDN